MTDWDRKGTISNKCQYVIWVWTLCKRLVSYAFN